MSQVRICDYKNCGEQVAETTVLTYRLTRPYGRVEVTLNEEKDWCPGCGEKTIKRLLREAVEARRTPRVKKEEKP